MASVYLTINILILIIVVIFYFLAILDVQMIFNFRFFVVLRKIRSWSKFVVHWKSQKKIENHRNLNFATTDFELNVILRVIDNTAPQVAHSDKTGYTAPVTLRFRVLIVIIMVK